MLSLASLLLYASHTLQHLRARKKTHCVHLRLDLKIPTPQYNTSPDKTLRGRWSFRMGVWGLALKTSHRQESSKSVEFEIRLKCKDKGKRLIPQQTFSTLCTTKFSTFSCDLKARSSTWPGVQLQSDIGTRKYVEPWLPIRAYYRGYVLYVLRGFGGGGSSSNGIYE